MTGRKVEFGELIGRALGEMSMAQGDVIRLESVIGEMGNDLDALVPLPNGVDLAAIKAGDDDPLEVVVLVESGRSKRGINYTDRALGEIAKAVNEGGLPGYLGHQKQEDINTQFPDPVTHWVAAKQDGKKFMFRGVVDKAAENLKRWIRSKRVTQTSIFGIPKLARANGEISAVGYEPISIDWTPLHRAGMASAIVALGEMDRILQPGEKADETDKQTDKARRKRMGLEDALADLRADKATPQQVIGEMGWTPESVLKALPDVEVRDAFDKSAVKAIGEMFTEVGIDSGTNDEKLSAFRKRLGEFLERERDSRKDSHKGAVEKVVGEMVANVKGRPIVTDLAVAKLQDGDDETKIKKVVGELLEADHVKAALAGLTMGRAPAPSSASSGGGNEGGSENGKSAPAGLRTRKARI